MTPLTFVVLAALVGAGVGVAAGVAAWWFVRRHEREMKQTVIDDLQADAEHHRRVAQVYQSMAGELEQTALLLSSGRGGYSPLAGRTVTVNVKGSQTLSDDVLQQLIDRANETGARFTRVPCYALQAGAEMRCPCGLTWDVNDRAPPSCIGRTVPGA